MADERVIDFRDLRPKGRPGERREGPRRQEEQMLHLSEQVLLSMACLLVDRFGDPEVTDDESAEVLAGLAKAVDAYRACADRAFPSPSVTVPRETPPGGGNRATD